jgi:hypothetical protein
VLYVIQTWQSTGAVAAAVPCDNGIDQAIEVITARITPPEADDGGSWTTVTKRWQEAVRCAEAFGGDGHTYFNVGDGRQFRFGLVCIP